MTRQFRQGDGPVRSISRIADHRSTVPSTGTRGGSRAKLGNGRNNISGNAVPREPIKREPGATLEFLFQQNPDLKPGPFLAYVEQKFRLLGDMEMLREIRAYRAKHSR
jgi:hypothetical protein